MADSAELNSYVRNYLDDVSNIIKRLDASALERAIECLRAARDNGRTVFSCGNGGSGSIASEMVVDINKGGSYEKDKRFRMMSLSDNIATITAYANDVNYESVFVEQLKNFSTRDDVVIAISGSGDSQNILSAVEYANSIGCTTIGCTTAESGRLRDLATLPLLVPSNHMGHLEDCFYLMTHILSYAFIEDRC
ncbi:MAG: D-sedoheptulose-7-phosphate isomerase [Aeoliella sp.]